MTVWMPKEIAAAAMYLTKVQVAMVLSSDPDDITGRDGAGVELVGCAYQTAKALKRFGLGQYQGPGGPYSGMYWNNAHGLAVREYLKGNKACIG